MSARAFAIPALQALTVTLGTVACGPSIMGDWTLVEIDGDDSSYSQTTGNCTYTVSFEIDVSMDEKEDGKVLGTFDQSVSVSFRGCEGYGYADGSQELDSADGDIEAELDDDEWEIEIDIDNGGDVAFTCTIEDDEMECEDDDTDVDYLFERD